MLVTVTVFECKYFLNYLFILMYFQYLSLIIAGETMNILFMYNINGQPLSFGDDGESLLHLVRSNPKPH